MTKEILDCFNNTSNKYHIFEDVANAYQGMPLRTSLHKKVPYVRVRYLESLLIDLKCRLVPLEAA